MYVCMHRMGVPLRHASVPMLGLGLVGAAPISCSTYLLVLFHLLSEMHKLANGF